MYKFAKQEGDKVNGSNADQIGQWAAIMYQITGDGTYASRALSILKNNLFWTGLPSQYNGNPVREYGQMLVLIYDWIYPGISAEDRATFRTKLGSLLNFCANGGSDAGGSGTALNTRTGDTDQCTGEWTAIGMWAYADDDPGSSAPTWWATIGGSAVTPQVALDNPIRHPGSTGNPNPVNARNAMYYYINKMATGGEWIEGSFYSLGTVQLLTFGVEAMRAQVPTGDLDDIIAWYPDWGRRMVHYGTNDFLESVQYGDIQTEDVGTSMLGYQWLSVALAGAYLNADNAVGPYAQRRVLDHLALVNFPFGSANAIPTPRSFLMFDPDQTAAATVDGIGLTFVAPGQGQLISRDSWASTRSLFWTQWLPGCKFVHHQGKYNGAFQLWRRGHWAVTHPQAYASGSTGTVEIPSNPGSNNSMRTLGFFSTPPWYAGSGPIPDEAIDGFSRVWQHVGADFVYQCGTAGGQCHPTGQYASPPPTAMHENTRTTVMFHSTDGTSDVVVLCDRVNANDPESLASFTRYTAVEQGLITNAQALKECMFFAKNQPTIGGAGTSHGQVFTNNLGAIEWTDEGGDPVRVDTLLPAGMNKIVEDFSNAAIGGSAYVGAERVFWRTSTYPGTEVQWDVFLNVVTCRNSGVAAPTVTLITGTVNRVGCLVARTGQDNRVVVFNGTQGADLPAFNTYTTMKAVLHVVRYQTVSFSFGYTQTTTNAKVIVCDLDPTRSWTYTINGGGSQALTVDSATGLASITVTGTGAKTIAVNT